MFVQIRKFLLVGLVVVITATVAYFGVKSVLDIKTGGNGDSEAGLITLPSSGDVVGISGVPSYPGSEFMFEDDIENDVVQRFLSSGQSSYVLPIDTEWEQVALYYETELPKIGWTHVFSVDLADEERLSGEYWVLKVQVLDESGMNTDEIDLTHSFGLRIYSKINGVWYEKLTLEQAESGLSSVVAREREIELMLAMGSVQELPETFPWKLAFPEIWDVEIKKALLIEAPLAEFSSIDSDGSVIVEPIAFNKDVPMEEVAEEFIEEVNSRRSEEDVFSVSSTDEIKIAEQDALLYLLKSGERDSWVAVMTHPDNGIIYAVSAFDADEAFFNYVVENLALEE